MDRDDDIVKFAAVLDEFSAAQRAQGINQSRIQKLVFARQFGEGQLQFEAVIDESAPASEIYEMLARVDAACDRLKAKRDLNEHYSNLLNICGQIEATQKKLAEDTIEYEAKNAAANRNRRVPVVMTDAQGANLKQHRDSIKAHFGRIEENQKAATECLRVLGGEDPLRVLADQIKARLDKLGGGRAAAA